MPRAVIRARRLVELQDRAGRLGAFNLTPTRTDVPSFATTASSRIGGGSVCTLAGKSGDSAGPSQEIVGAPSRCSGQRSKSTAPLSSNRSRARVIAT